MTPRRASRRPPLRGESAAWFLLALPGGILLTAVCAFVAWGLWFGSSNDGDGPGQRPALALGMAVPLVLGALLTLVRSGRAFGGGILAGAIGADLALIGLVILADMR